MSDKPSDETLYNTIFNQIKDILGEFSRNSISRTEAQEKIAEILMVIFEELNVTIGINPSNVISLRSRPAANLEQDDHWDIQCRLVADYFIENGFNPEKVDIRDNDSIVLLRPQ